MRSWFSNSFLTNKLLTEKKSSFIITANFEIEFVFVDDVVNRLHAESVEEVNSTENILQPRHWNFGGFYLSLEQIFYQSSVSRRMVNVRLSVIKFFGCFFTHLKTWKFFCSGYIFCGVTSFKHWLISYSVGFNL